MGAGAVAEYGLTVSGSCFNGIHPPLRPLLSESCRAKYLVTIFLRNFSRVDRLTYAGLLYRFGDLG